VKSVLLGAGPRLGQRGSDYPGFLREHDGRMMLELILSSVARVSEKPILMFRESDERSYHLSSIVRQIDSGAKTINLATETAGAACTALLAMDLLDLDEELLILNLTDFANVDLRKPIEEFRSRKATAGTLVFESLHPRYSFVRIENGEVREVAEKNPISRHATAGVYWFANASIFLEAAKSMIVKRAAVDHLFYVAPTLNEVILSGGLVLAHEISSMDYIEMKSGDRGSISTTEGSAR
jgi:dTDP-glucose pyrophosphorylase